MKDMSAEGKNFQVEFKLLSTESGLGTFEGYGSVFNNVDNTGDIVQKGAFLESIANKKFPMLWQHDPAQPIGHWLEVREDEKGLYLKGALILEVEKAREAHALMKNGVLNGLSIGYRVKQSSRDEKTGVRNLKKLDLIEVSLVTFPANESATVTAVKTAPTKRDIEKVLIDSGLGRNQAKALISGGWKALPQELRDADEGDDSEDVQRDADEKKKTEVERLKSILNTINGETQCLMKSKK